MLTTVEVTHLTGLLHRLDTEKKGIEYLLQSIRSQPVIDELKIQRLKRRQDSLREEISKIRSIILPDIIA